MLLSIFFGLFINLYILYAIYHIIKSENNCIKLTQIKFLNVSSFQLKNSNINIIDQNTIIHTYQINHLIFTNIDSIYNQENNIKNNILYIIGRGKIGTWKGTGEFLFRYNNSIHISVLFQ